MGAKQSKRSVDISGKEAEGAGEVAAAGAGGEGRVEQLADADADALKPQLNGDAHIHEPSDKEKHLDSGTPENEKDATTEKEGKEQDEKDKEISPVINGDSEQKGENGETTPSPEDAKKPKKEKVKKKWSLRSISFSRKDKPKQEKKQKEDEPKANGEADKVPEEAAEFSPVVEKQDIVPEEVVESEIKEEKNPETPVTEPITNGSNTPETPKEEILTADEPTAETVENDRTEPRKVETVPETLPVNGILSEESNSETREPMESESSKPEETTDEKSESVPATEIPVKNEVCVETMPLIEPTPPPLPANPPPSSVASFAATTMAPDAPAAPADNILADNTKPEQTEAEVLDTTLSKAVIQPTQQPSISITDADEKPIEGDFDDKSQVENTEVNSNETLQDVPTDDLQLQSPSQIPSDEIIENNPTDKVLDSNQSLIETPVDDLTKRSEIVNEIKKTEKTKDDELEAEVTTTSVIKSNVCSDNIENEETEIENGVTITRSIVENGIDSIEDSKPVMNGSASPEASVSEAASLSPPPPPQDPLQEVVSASEKLAELIPEIPSVPEIKTELEATSEVAAAN